jgi:hypothetical protein
MATVTVERRLRCESVGDGPRGGEKWIVLRERGGGRQRFVVPAEAVRGGCVTVQVWFEEDGRTWAVIPFNPDRRFMIDEGDLLDAAASAAWDWDRAAADRRDRGLLDIFG